MSEFELRLYKVGDMGLTLWRSIYLKHLACVPRVGDSIRWRDDPPVIVREVVHYADSAEDSDSNSWDMDCWCEITVEEITP